MTINSANISYDATKYVSLLLMPSLWVLESCVTVLSKAHIGMAKQVTTSKSLLILLDLT